MDIDTPHGPARVHLEEPAQAPNLLLVLGHGAGGGVEAPDLLAVGTAALAGGAVVARVEQPYRVAGRRAPAPARQLDAAWVEVLRELTACYPGLPVVTGGRSSGGRVACRTARATGSIAVLALAFPLIPPRDRPATGPALRSFRENVASTALESSNFPEIAQGTEAAQPAPGAGQRSRVAELYGAGVPVLVINGDRDTFGVPKSEPPVVVHVVAGADHSLRRGRPEIAEVVARWLVEQRVREQ